MEEGIRQEGTEQEDTGRKDTAEGAHKQTECRDNLHPDILHAFGLEKRRRDIRTLSPLTLAYIGDAVYDLIVRTVVVELANRPANELHRMTVKYVSANAQSKIVQALLGSLTEEEQAVYRRGKNAKPHTTAKNASHADYMKATGFEAVLGYLYLSDSMERVLELVEKGVSLIDSR